MESTMLKSLNQARKMERIADSMRTPRKWYRHHSRSQRLKSKLRLRDGSARKSLKKRSSKSRRNLRSYRHRRSERRLLLRLKPRTKLNRCKCAQNRSRSMRPTIVRLWCARRNRELLRTECQRIAVLIIVWSARMTIASVLAGESLAKAFSDSSVKRSIVLFREVKAISLKM